MLTRVIFGPKEIFPKNDNIGKFYRELIQFLEVFSLNNPTNQLQLFPYVEKLLDLALYPEPPSEARGSMVAPEYNISTVKITRLVICILSNQRTNQPKMEKTIRMIINKIIDLGERLCKLSSLFSVLTGDNVPQNSDLPSPKAFQDQILLQDEVENPAL
jgi:hypothetical protein